MKMKPFFQYLSTIRSFFQEKGFIEVSIPPLVENPGMETHIHPFEVFSKNDSTHAGYLHTSPEFMMKKILSSDEFENIFTLSYSFRDEPKSPIHRSQFLMLEWYRKNQRYEKILEDTIELIQACAHSKRSFQILTVNDLFKKYLDFEILDYLDFDSLHKIIKEKFKDIPLSEDMSSWRWDDLFFILFLNKIEPRFKDMGWIVVKDYPAELAALSTINKDDSRICERFEIYIDGIEIANCFNELTDLNELKARFDHQNQEKQNLYSYKLPEPNKFYETMKNYPASAGIALGVERLFMALTQQQNFFIED